MSHSVLVTISVFPEAIVEISPSWAVSANFCLVGLPGGIWGAASLPEMAALLFPPNEDT